MERRRAGAARTFATMKRRLMGKERGEPESKNEDR